MKDPSDVGRDVLTGRRYGSAFRVLIAVAGVEASEIACVICRSIWQTQQRFYFDPSQLGGGRYR